MQLSLYLFFTGSPWDLADLIISFYKKNHIKYKEAYREHETITALGEWFVAWIESEEYPDNFLGYLEEEYNVAVNNHIYFQLYPGCNEELFSGFIAYLLANVKGDFFLNSECDELILLRNSKLYIENEAWKKYLENMTEETV